MERVNIETETPTLKLYLDSEVAELSLDAVLGLMIVILIAGGASLLEAIFSKRK